MEISKKTAFLHPKDDETEVIEVLPRYPFNFSVHLETDPDVRNLVLMPLDCKKLFYSYQGI